MRRDEWLATFMRLATPVLDGASRGQLRAAMPVEAQHGHADARRQYAHLEAAGRLLAGMGPWLALDDVPGEERSAQEECRELWRRALAIGTDPSEPAAWNFAAGHQPIVDAAFLAHGLYRCGRSYWESLPRATREQIQQALRATRGRKPFFNNWLLFGAMIEAFLAWTEADDWDPMRVDYGVRQHEQWYKGDGAYGDGPDFHWDYYNSFVIQPMLLDVLAMVRQRAGGWRGFEDRVLERALRYAVVLERFVAPDGSFPAIGRSLAYRCGAFHLLAQVALMEKLPDGLPPAQVRSALGAVITRTLSAPGTFDDGGWLRIGLFGHQPELGEPYVSTGSLYLASVAFLPLGLSEDRPFWSQSDQPWTSQRLTQGLAAPLDGALRT